MSLDISQQYFSNPDKEEIGRALETFEYAIDDALEKAMLFSVSSQWSAEEAMNLIAKLKGYIKKIEEVRKRVNEPHRKATIYNNEKCRPFTDKLERIEHILFAKINAWKVKYEEEQKLLEQEAEQLKNALQLDVSPHITREATLRTSEALVYEKTQWKFDIECLSEVPRQYLMIDEEKVEAALKSGVREIPGLKVYQEKKTIIRSR